MLLHTAEVLLAARRLLGVAAAALPPPEAPLLVLLADRCLVTGMDHWRARGYSLFVVQCP